MNKLETALFNRVIKMKNEFNELTKQFKLLNHEYGKLRIKEFNSNLADQAVNGHEDMTAEEYQNYCKHLDYVIDEDRYNKDQEAEAFAEYDQEQDRLQSEHEKLHEEYLANQAYQEERQKKEEEDSVSGFWFDKAKKYSRNNTELIKQISEQDSTIKKLQITLAEIREIFGLQEN